MRLFNDLNTLLVLIIFFVEGALAQTSLLFGKSLVHLGVFLVNFLLLSLACLEI